MKERLTGAIILVVLIVLLVPELLTGPIRAKPAPGASSSAQTPHLGPTSPVKAPLRTYTLTLGAPPPVEQALVTAAAQAGARQGESVPQSATGSHEAGLAAPGEDAPSPTATAAVSQPSSQARSRLQAANSPARPLLRRQARSSGSRGGWVVQLGSFASRDNANRLARSLRSRGFRVSVSAARAGPRVLWRVRAGPVSDRTHAGRLAARLRALGHRGELLPLQ